jgi:antitoxin ParD1/3/4
VELMMASAEKISIALTQELAADIRKAVASGEYASTSEGIRDALRAWKQHRRSHTAVLEELQRLWSDGVLSGESMSLDSETIKRRGRERLAERSPAPR